MIAPEQLYGVIITVLLLVALGVSIPVLVRLVRDGLERHRKWRTGELERYPEDEEYDRVPDASDEADPAVKSRLTCRQCGAENDREFTYCRRCTAPL